MKKSKISKVMLVMVLSCVMGIVLSNFNIVRAVDDDEIWATSTSDTTNNTSDDDGWDTPKWENAVVNTSTNNTANTANTANNTSNVFGTTNNTTNNVSTTTSNANSLAKTGIEDLTGTVAIVLVVCGIVAIYSLKKVKEYKDM